ncbi:MAG: hypothetical protein ABIP35_03790 [Ginsengibacter sp.]
MSVVTNLIICFSLLENEEKIVNEFKGYTHNGHPFVIKSVSDEKLPKGWYGGEKYLECIILIGAYNNLNLDILIEYMETEIKWQAPDLVQVLAKEENDMKFKLIELISR